MRCRVLNKVYKWDSSQIYKKNIKNILFVDIKIAILNIDIQEVTNE